MHSCCVSGSVSSQLNFLSCSFRPGTTSACRKSMISDRGSKDVSESSLSYGDGRPTAAQTSIGQHGPVGDSGNFQPVECFLHTH